MKTTLYTFSIILLLIFTVRCTKENLVVSEVQTPKLPQSEYDYLSSQNMNGQFFADNTPSNNLMSNAGATLGRVLFYDKQLSINNTISCGSCHKQSLAFSDDVALSVGFGGVETSRNSPPIMNLRSSNFFFWDFSENSLENQVLAPIKNHVEMGMENLDYLENKLSDLGYYKPLFQSAFGKDEITKENISKAMAQFIRSIVTTKSDFDLALAQQDLSLLSPIEYFGSKVFLESGCNDCHQAINGFSFVGGDAEILFFDDPSGYGGTGTETANIGLDKSTIDEGAGLGRFKVPSLRNIAFTAPYMHDGRFTTLEEVIDHYDRGVKNNEFLDSRLKFQGSPMRLNLNLAEKNALIAFLLSMTDTAMMIDPKYSDPFIK